MTPEASLQTAYQLVGQLVERFEENKGHYLSSAFKEQEARTDFIDKFFTALGWDVKHEQQTNPYEQEVKIEKSVTTGAAKRRADYAFLVKPDYRHPRFFVEAKSPQLDIGSPDNYFQAIRYGWGKQIPIVGLTDFCSFHIIDSRYKPDIKYALSRGIRTYSYRDYLKEDAFAEIYWLFSREAVAAGSIGKYADSLPTPKPGAKQLGLLPGAFQSVDEAFLEQLDQYRDTLARSFKRTNEELTGDQLTELVQRTLDRLVFMRFLEDKLIEPQPIVAALGTKKSAWRDFVFQSRRLDGIYNGIVFKAHRILDDSNLLVDDADFLPICDELSDSQSPYDFNSIPVEILGRIYERFLGKVVVATKARARVEEKPEVRKAGGVYYTPDYIVHYLVENSMGSLVGAKAADDVLKLRVIDTSCGSGSFLIGVFDYLIRYLTRFYIANPVKAKPGELVNRDGAIHLSLKKKREILLRCIYGIDIDAQAVEVAQLSLYLKLLEEETTQSAKEQLEFREALLPPLNRNIIVGNSLLSAPELEAGKDLFSAAAFEQLHAVDFRRSFEEVMNRQGGFDLVIGNPPYIKEYTNREAFEHVLDSPYYEGKMDIWYMFACRGLDILKSKTGILAFIATNNWISNYGAKRLRRKIAQEAQLLQLVDFGDFKVFRDAGIQTMILIARKDPAKAQYAFDYRRLAVRKPVLQDAMALLAGEQRSGLTKLRPTFERAAMIARPYAFSTSSTTEVLRKLEAKRNFALDGKTEIAQGIVPNPDVVSARALALISQKDRVRRGIDAGAPVFVVPCGHFANATVAESALLKPLFEPTDVARYAVKGRPRLQMIYSTRTTATTLPARIRAHLEPYRPIMDERRETRAGRIPWFHLHWPRDARFFESGPKILAVRKCEHPTFAYVEAEAFVMMAFNVIKSERISMQFLVALLNSKVIEYWLRHRGKIQGNNFQIDKEPLLALPLVCPETAMQEKVAKLAGRVPLA